jgi:hypothetical protein
VTVKEQLHSLIEELDDQRAIEVLDFITHGSDTRKALNLADIPPITEDDPLWNIIDLVGDEYDGPTDVSSNKYRYIAEHPEIKLD